MRLLMAGVVLALSGFVGCGPTVSARGVTWSASGNECTVSFVVWNPTPEMVNARVEIVVAALVPAAHPGRGARSMHVLAEEVTSVEVAAGSEVRVRREVAVPGFIRPSLVRVRIL